MAVSQPLAIEFESAGAGTALSQPLAPEDVCAGDFVAILHVTYELPSFFWCADTFLIPHNEPVRLQFLPEDDGVPLKVRSVCLPFVLVKSPSGEHRALDVRKCRLARLDRRYAKIAWKVGKRKPRAKPLCT